MLYTHLHLSTRLARDTRLIREKLAATQGSAIAINVLVMNLEKLLELLFVLVAFWSRVLLGTEVADARESAACGYRVVPA
ncbi:hypothetical protein EVJ50_02210 [Synechococcus sp. RSCCF101]|nr:hypothetical protein EVJ50_02210 [Synechococcus sp. RSCCF101]